MTYPQTIEYLYNATPMFQNIGAAAYKPGLETAIKLAKAFGNPQNAFYSIHVAGTNGKGSTCHTLAAILQAQGYKVGLYTSPHLIDFRERIKVNGQLIPEDAVISFVSRYRSLNLDLQPSFFELTTVMAFDWFKQCGCDICVIESGLGGRLDTTNIINPLLSVITNISFDHKAQLGNTLKAIATEKAGIIKPGIPVVIGNADGEGVKETFGDTAKAKGSPISFSNELNLIEVTGRTADFISYSSKQYGHFEGALTGDCQPENSATVINAVNHLVKLGIKIDRCAVHKGFAQVIALTGLMGRWQKVASEPTIICDTGHNSGGWAYLAPRLDGFGNKLHIVIGFVNDKDVSAILEMLPKNAHLYFTQASVQRALPVDVLVAKAIEHGLYGAAYSTVSEAVYAAKQNAAPDDTIFVGGSTFIVADLLSGLQ